MTKDDNAESTPPRIMPENRPVSSDDKGAHEPAHGKKLRTRHVTMITLGGIIGASLFAALAEKGLAPAVVAKRTQRGVPAVVVIASTIGGLVATLVNFIAPGSGIYDFIMNSTGLVALFVAVPVAEHHPHCRCHRHRGDHDGQRHRPHAGVDEFHRGRPLLAFLPLTTAAPDFRCCGNVGEVAGSVRAGVGLSVPANRHYTWLRPAPILAPVSTVV